MDHVASGSAQRRCAGKAVGRVREHAADNRQCPVFPAPFMPRDPNTSPLGTEYHRSSCMRRGTPCAAVNLIFETLNINYYQTLLLALLQWLLNTSSSLLNLSMPGQTLGRCELDQHNGRRRGCKYDMLRSRVLRKYAAQREHILITGVHK